MAASIPPIPAAPAKEVAIPTLRDPDDKKVRLLVYSDAGSESVTVTNPDHHGIANLLDAAARLMKSDLNWSMGTHSSILAGADQDTDGNGAYALLMVQRWLQ